ncbi:hypothetical protein NDU88_006544 [Pleurodeles waltl]|uniref:Uncharacterized protein n=1 Tax=Pleurodeles waltl TaxID=8319 RepID=A0AAV7NUD3_PLEWA|nr:hypothetical protein NDU88_006544 [Pleurodeles waltl]
MFGVGPGPSAKRLRSARPVLTPSVWCADAPGPHRPPDLSVMFTAWSSGSACPSLSDNLDGYFNSLPGPVRARHVLQRLAVPLLVPGPTPFRRQPLPPLFSVMGVPAPASLGHPTHFMMLLVSCVGISTCFRSAVGAAILTKGSVFP